jgi:TonB family protein
MMILAILNKISKMKNCILSLLFLQLVFFGFSQSNYSQDILSLDIITQEELAPQIGYDIRGFNSRPITKDKVNKAKTLADINAGYPSSWIGEYISVKMMVTNDGMVNKTEAKNAQLSLDQIKLLNQAAIGSEINVEVKFIQKSTVSISDVKTMNFSYTIVPDVEAEYPGGRGKMLSYIKQNVINQISEEKMKNLQFASVRFSIDEEGKVVNAKISMTSNDQEIDQLILKTVNTMPLWKPAENSEGIPVKQAFEFTLGNQIGC